MEGFCECGTETSGSIICGGISSLADGTIIFASGAVIHASSMLLQQLRRYVRTFNPLLTARRILTDTAKGVCMRNGLCHSQSLHK